MKRSFASLRRRRTTRISFVAVVAVAVAFGLAYTGRAVGLTGAVSPPPASPTSADQIQNVDQVKTAIKAYYGDTIDTRLNPIDSTPLHTFSPTGAYASEVGGIVDGAEKYLKKPNPGGNNPSNQGTPAIVFDVDDTTLNTYSYEIYTNFVFNPASNATFVNSGVFRAVPHMVDLEHFAESNGYTVFFLTGRPESQRVATEANLTNEGYDVVNANVYLKDQTLPWLGSCTPTCTTTQYKTLTRQHIESLGFDLVGNFGDQFSDLTGGFANQTFKMPNPMYFLP